ncbi:MAG: protoporphyrinogen oxidase HemJ [Pseudomonadota bacterium]
MLADLYLWLKAFHIMSVLAWMAGLFYLPRLYVHHVERAKDNEEMASVFVMMEQKLLRLIMNPSMIAAWIFGLLLVGTGAVDWSAVWPYTKLVSILGMTWFHMWLAKHRKLLAAGSYETEGRTYRIMNEVPTLLMVVIVISVVVKPL